MVKFILKRIGTMIIAMFMIILITFTLMHSIPGGPFTNTKGVPEEVTQAMEAKVDAVGGWTTRTMYQRSCSAYLSVPVLMQSGKPPVVDSFANR